ncbi:MAG: glucose-1-phosphate adenylyltransferase [Candidatus Omnitrophica bacterium]|nr:glucose-1-phosphate adenylyltransferase [Candidatus Omnitrophota bacterium]MCM8826681.1 glucose-1-phosphate adenylyltransferase [Candidatus Omnitrophota bacterium]
MLSFKKSVLAIVLAGGKGERLYPLTLERTKPSVPFGGKYRIIDFALSNLVNSGIYSIYVLVQYKSQSLIEHIRTTWRKGGIFPHHFITVVPPQMRRTKEWYRGTADSVYQNINLIYDYKPKLVAIFSGDHIYRMDISQMVVFHLKKKADLTISVVPISSKEANKFGVVHFDKDLRVTNFIEKPESLAENSSVFASMGNYIFNADTLINTLEEKSKDVAHYDFGRDVIPYLVEKRAKVFAYDFSFNKIPARKRYEDKFYWRDVGTIESYWQANMDILGKFPKLDLDNREWPIYASDLYSPPAYVLDSLIENSLISEGTRILGAKVENSILGRGVKIEKGCEVTDSIIMDFTHLKNNCKIRRAIIDRFNILSENTSIGFDKNLDKKKYFVDSSGIVVLKRGLRRNFYT